MNHELKDGETPFEPESMPKKGIGKAKIIITAILLTAAAGVIYRLSTHRSLDALIGFFPSVILFLFTQMSRGSMGIASLIYLSAGTTSKGWDKIRDNMAKGQIEVTTEFRWLISVSPRPALTKALCFISYLLCIPNALAWIFTLLNFFSPVPFDGIIGEICFYNMGIIMATVLISAALGRIFKKK